jgi:XTP/dITP diphosphohydrolase
VVATRNPGKLREFRRLLSPLGTPVLSLDDAGVTVAVEETGATYEDNATLKAIAYARACREITLADDSGIEVDALGGEPGVMSAVYTGPGQSDAQRTAQLLERMRLVPAERRTARYRAVLAIAAPVPVTLFRGTCEGAIAEAPRGANGFGYDPVFLLPQLGRTMAELTDAEKDRISHRGGAVRAAIACLRTLVG